MPPPSSVSMQGWQACPGHALEEAASPAQRAGNQGRPRLVSAHSQRSRGGTGKWGRWRPATARSTCDGSGVQAARVGTGRAGGQHGRAWQYEGDPLLAASHRHKQAVEAGIMGLPPLPAFSRAPNPCCPPTPAFPPPACSPPASAALLGALGEGQAQVLAILHDFAASRQARGGRAGECLAGRRESGLWNSSLGGGATLQPPAPVPLHHRRQPPLAGRDPPPPRQSHLQLAGTVDACS